MPIGENYGRTSSGELIGPYDTVEELNRELAESNAERPCPDCSSPEWSGVRCYGDGHD